MPQNASDHSVSISDYASISDSSSGSAAISNPTSISSKAQRKQTDLQLRKIRLSQSGSDQESTTRQNKNDHLNSKCSEFETDKNLDFPDEQLNSVMSDLSRLSKSFVNSYQNLEGQVEQLNGQLQDVSEQRSEALEEKQTLADRLQHLLSILPSGVVVLDGQGVVRECNAVAIDILGRPLLGESWLNVINRAFMPQADDGHQISLKDGRKVHIETRALDSEPGQMIVLTDMTKTRQLQAELSQQQKLSSMGTMIASLAHQIRTPLAAAILYGSHLNGESLSDSKKQQFSQHLMERLRFMDRQISDMLNFVKGDKKQKSYFKVETLFKSIKNTCDGFSYPLKITNELANSKTILMLGDLDAIVGAINNLVDNAIDASKNNSTVSLNISSSQQSRLIIEVRDQGEGISKEDQKKLFEPFYSTKNHGNGLGLAIVQAIVVEHGGLLQVDSIKGEGSRFIIDLPLCVSKQHRLSKQLSKSQPDLKKEYSEKGNVEGNVEEKEPAAKITVAKNNTSQERIYDC